MGKPTYWELLRHPNWQRKRLEVMERDGFTCVVCRATDKTLNVHHSYYEKGNAPWDYPSESLKTLCEECHSATHEVLTDINRQIGTLPNTNYLLQVWGYTSALQACLSPDTVIVVHGPSMLSGIADATGVPSSKISLALIDRQIDGSKLIDLMAEEHKWRG